MLGSAVQQVIALSDAVLLYHKGETEFAAIGFAGVFYITIAAVGYSFSRGGQIMIARRIGEGTPEKVGHIFHTMLLFELVLALIMWAVMRYASPFIFRQFVDHSPEVYQSALEYIYYRAYGIFFSYAGVALISLYTGISRPFFIFITTVVLAAVNLLLNYVLIFGRWGFPEMGIGGSGLASSIAEIIAFVLFLGYIIYDRRNRSLRIFTWPTFDWPMTAQQLRLSLAVVAQAAVGQGSWIFFFGVVENLGTRALAVSNLARTVYLLLSIPLWGFATGTNTLISTMLGQGKKEEVLASAIKIGKLCFLVSMAVALPVLLFPKIFLAPILSKTDMSLLEETRPIFLVLLGVVALASFGMMLFNAIAGIGAMGFGIVLQGITVVVYIGLIYFIIQYTAWGLVAAWSTEIFYWIILMSLTYWYLRSKRWHHFKV